MTKNEIVARWIGYSKTTHVGVDKSVRWEHTNGGKIWNVQFAYDSSYDWLIPAWVKFRDLKFDRHDIQNEHFLICVSILNKIGYNTITEAFDKLVKGIIWYQSLQK